MFISPDGHSARLPGAHQARSVQPAAWIRSAPSSDAASRRACRTPNWRMRRSRWAGIPPRWRTPATTTRWTSDSSSPSPSCCVVVLIPYSCCGRSSPRCIWLAPWWFSFFAALGIGVLVFQYMFGQQLHWIGAATGLRGAGRRRCRLQPALRFAVARPAVSARHGTASSGRCPRPAVSSRRRGLIFAASMRGLLFSSIGTVGAGRVRHRYRNPCWTPSWSGPSPCLPWLRWSERRTGGRLDSQRGEQVEHEEASRIATTAS